MGEFFRGFIVSDSEVEPVCTIGLRRSRENLKPEEKFNENTQMF
jgi:hypothetical protein